MNPSLAKSLTIHNEKVAPTTEGQFNDNFWDSLDFVINALDNMIARKVSSFCNKLEFTAVCSILTASVCSMGFLCLNRYVLL
jgi:hypothetical protein